MRRLLLTLFAGLCLYGAAPAAEGDLPDWAKGSTVTQLFNDEKYSDQFLASDPAVWKYGKDKDGKGYIELAYDRKTYKSGYSPKHRSPVHILLQKTAPWKDFVFDVEMMSTTEPYGHQDLCLFFGFESPEKYYYVHIAKAADMNAHNVFIVNEAARKNIAKETTKGVDWKKDTWHKVRLVRRASTGLIEVYFDDMTKPIMKAEDKTFQEGYVGIGSFDDTGRFRNGAIYHQEVTIDGDKKLNFFKPLGKEKMIPLSVLDAFTDVPFAGNPAAVCLLDRWPTDTWLQLVGREMNLSETAFLVPRTNTEYELRWFTPKVEVALCGHATLASAHFLWSSGTVAQEALTFHTRKSGALTARRLPSGEIELDFPARPAGPCNPPPGMLEALGARAVVVGRNADDYLVVLGSDAEVRALAPDFARLAQTLCRGVIVTARAADPQFDFVSRFFAPAAGIDEDPVTGSAHCCLSEWWGEALGKDEMTGFQASERGGVVRVKRANGRVKLIGRAVTVTTGHLACGPVTP